MDWERLLMFLGGGVGVALIGLVSERLKRRDAEEDAQTARNEADEKAAQDLAARRTDAAAQVEELRSETAESLKQVDERIGTLETKVDLQSKKIDAGTAGTKAQLFNTINHLGNKYIANGPFIDASELHGLLELWAGYIAVIGDPAELTDGPKAAYEYLCRLMAEVGKLKIRS